MMNLKSSMPLLRRDKPKYIFYAVFILAVILVAVMIILTVRRIKNHADISSFEQQIANADKQIAKIAMSETYKRSEIADYISTTKKMNWGETIKSLSEKKQDLKESQDGSRIKLTSFVVAFDKMNIEGEVSSVDDITKPGGLIDRVRLLPFVEKYIIPTITKQPDSLKFSLDIKLINGSK